MGHAARYELKYLIQESRAVAVADFISSYLRPSEHNGSGPIRGHPVISLYLDSPDFFFFRQAFTGHKNRMKLRIRFYDDEWTRPAFLEVKRRVSEVICKDRAMISREGVRQILSAGWPNQPYFPDTSHSFMGNADRMSMRISGSSPTRVRARGAIYVSYFREIWESPVEEELRVTLDREVAGSRYDGSGELRVPKQGWRPICFPPYMAPLPKDFVVLELKFEERAPRWMLDLAEYSISSTSPSANIALASILNNSSMAGSPCPSRRKP